MAGSRRYNQQVPGEEPEPRTSESYVGSWYGKSTAHSIYVLLVCFVFCDHSTCTAGLIF